MNYKKAYKNALERMKSWARGEHPECFTEAQKAAEYIFPELAESEDERIRKALIRFHKSTIDIDGIKGEEILAWLEKQGKSKWSEEDEEMLSEIITVVKFAQDRNPQTQINQIIFDEEVNWLKSLKKRMGV